MHECVQELNRRLGPIARIVVEPVLRIPADLIGSESSVTVDAYGRTVGRFVSLDISRCAFELCFVDRETRFSLYLGRGAEFCENEPLLSALDAAELAGDVDRFLRSTVKCDRSTDAGGRVVREAYSPTLMVVDRLQLTFVYLGSPMSKSRDVQTQTVVYPPWFG